jgi:hypothetical protein
MPQLDKFTFFPVLTWVIFLLFVIYNILLVTGLPKIYKILYYRKKKVEHYSSKRDVLAEEHYYLLKTHKKLFTEFLNKIKFVPEVTVAPIEATIEVTKELKLQTELFQKDWLGEKKLCVESINKEDFEKN